MKRIERSTYNSIRKNTTVDTINVEIPVDYTHEARQAIHEYLTNKGMRVTGINWNSIQECYCIHWERAYTETADAIRQQQENADIDSVTEGMEYSDWTWNGYRKPAEAQETAEQEQTTETTETTNEQKEEDSTMNNTSTATKTAPVFVRTLEGEYIAIRDLSEEAKDLGYMATQYERYGSVTADEIIDAYIDERVNITIEDLETYNEYLRENNYYDDEIMSWDGLEDYLRDMPPLDAFKLAHNSDFSWNDDYFTFNGYGNLRGMQEHEVVRKMEEDRDFLKWYVEEREPIEDETMEQAIAYCNYLIKQGY